MAIPGMSGAAPMDPNYNMDSPVVQPEQNVEMFKYGDDFSQENYQRGNAAKASAEQFVKANAENLEYTSKWFDPDYITFTPPEGSKMTYGQLREALGIPPGLISKTNPPKQSLIDRVLGNEVDPKDKVIDKNVINKPIKIPVDQIGWYEMRMTDVEAMDARGQRANGNPYGGYDRNFRSNSEVSDMIKKYVKD